MKEVLASYIEQNKKEILEMSYFIFDNPELGLQEFQAVTKLKKYLIKHYFQIEENIYGFETAFRASYQVGKGGPSIGFLCE